MMRIINPHAQSPDAERLANVKCGINVRRNSKLSNVEI